MWTQDIDRLELLALGGKPCKNLELLKSYANVFLNGLYRLFFPYVKLFLKILRSLRAIGKH